MVILLAIVVVLVLFGLGFTMHALWIVAAVMFGLWVIGLAMGHGSGNRHRFFRW